MILILSFFALLITSCNFLRPMWPLQALFLDSVMAFSSFFVDFLSFFARLELALLSHNYHTLLDHCCWIHPFSVFVAKVDSVDAFCICRSQNTVNASVLVSSSIAYWSWGSSSNISCSSLCTSSPNHFRSSSFVTLVVADTVLSSSRCLFFAPSRSCKVLLSCDAPWFYWSPPATLATTACFNRLLSFLQDYLLSRCSNYCRVQFFLQIFWTSAGRGGLSFLITFYRWGCRYLNTLLQVFFEFTIELVTKRRYLPLSVRICWTFAASVAAGISSLHRRRCWLEAIDSCRWFLNVIASMRSRPAQ